MYAYDNISRYQMIVFLFYQKIGLDWEVICMKCQFLFSGYWVNNIPEMDACITIVAQIIDKSNRIKMYLEII